ncbi:class I SAM-dependent methyltransferase [Aestuariispira insulae]|uniref:Ubiquinone/menaquinone biosynthesis C-methylase UbiE n=1 Tax=Aestuariispira insulae TaxID=1461337 RepID=A0A3D9HGN7_9PROT|nr:class I SAM-dependent methyltransferase [Aestuariispira insulae]RED48630.1 ubiquinone/menaquinone biosynthesis C-methylase UbiE [Aestuariispira insulae]
MRDIDLSEYDRPDLYDLENGTDQDLDFFLAQARQTGGPVLDIACGTGRIGIPLAREGYQVTGVDLSEPMLVHGRGLAGELPISFLKADCRDFDLRTRFPLVFMTGHGFQNLIRDEDQAALFGCVRRHLAPGGRFVFETRNRDISPLASSCDRKAYRSYRMPNGEWIDCSIKQDYDRKTSCLHYRIWRENRRSGEVWQGSGLLRFPSEGEIRLGLKAAGLEVVSCYGDWGCEAASRTAPERIFVCQLMA